MGIVCLLALVGGVSLYAVSSGACSVWDHYQALAAGVGLNVMSGTETPCWQ